MTQPSTTLRTADRIVDALATSGVERCYGVPGGAIGPIYDALVGHRRVRAIHVRHESHAAFMAIGHHRVRPDDLACVLTTSGPGLTNALTGLASAHAEGVPMVVIAGEVPRSKVGRGALQDGSSSAMDVIGMARSVVRSAERVEVAAHAPLQLAAAAERARTERGPVLLSLPLDLALEPIPPQRFVVSSRRWPTPDSDFVDSVCNALAGATAPLVVLGADARHSAVEIRRWVERLRIPVVSGPDAKGIVAERSRCCLGVFGYGGHPSTRAFLERHPPDVVLVLGSTLSEVATSSWSPLLQASRTMIQLGYDARTIGRNYRLDLAFAGDWRPIVAALDERLHERGELWPEPTGVMRLESEREHVDRVPLHPARVMRVLQDALPADTRYAADVGENLLFAIHHLEANAPDQFLCALETGSMGSGLGIAVGAKAADPSRTVVAVAGDYAFQMYGMELNTAVQYGWDVVFVVMNDARMRMVEAGQTRIYGRCLDMGGPLVDFAEIARAHGAAGFVAQDSAGLRRALADRPRDRPLVLDCRIDPEASFSVNARIDDLSHFSRR